MLLLFSKISVAETIKLKLLRMCLGELGQTTFEARRLDEASPMDEALNRLNRMQSTEDNTSTRNNNPDTSLYRHELKDLLQKHSSRPESPILRLLLNNASQIATGEIIMVKL